MSEESDSMVLTASGSVETMKRRIYYKLDGVEHGPISLERLRQLFENDDFVANALVKTTRSNKWRKASSINPPRQMNTVEISQASQVDEEDYGFSDTLSEAMDGESLQELPYRARSHQLAAVHPRKKKRKESQERKTDMFAILAFAFGMLSLLMLPILFAPICYVCAIISYYRLKENPELKGQGIRIVGAICGVISILYLLFVFQYLM